MGDATDLGLGALIAIVAELILLALVARRGHYRRIRVGFFVEREPEAGPDE